MFCESERFIQEQVDDLEIPEEIKIELRNTLEEFKKDTKVLKETYGSDKVIVDRVLKKVNKISKFIVNEVDVELIQVYENVIFKVNTGFSRSDGFYGNIPNLDTILRC